MALVNCRECGKQMSKAAKACPSCGAPPAKRTNKFTWFVLAVILIGVVAAFLGQRPEQVSKTATTVKGSGSAEPDWIQKLNQERAQISAEFKRDRAKIIAEIKRLNSAAKYEEASALAHKYNGEGDQEVATLKQIADDKIMAPQIAKAKAAARKEGVRVGMTKEEVLGAAGGSRHMSIRRQTRSAQASNGCMTAVPATTTCTSKATF